MPKITNPEKQCKTTPVSFSGESKILAVEKEDCRRGVILDSLEELGQAIRVYNGGSVPGARATQNDLMEDLENRGRGMDAALLLGVGLTHSDKFIKRLVDEAVSSLKSNGKFSASFDYEAIGTNFVHTSINGSKVGDKYTLELCAACVGSAPEGKLAEILGKPRALVNSRAKARLSVVDDWWFNLNLEDAVRGLPLSAEALKDTDKWAQYLVSGGYSGKTPEFEFEHRGRKFTLRIGLDTDKHLRPEGGNYESEYIKARGKSIVGGAWTVWDETGNNNIEPRAVPPLLVCYVSIPGERYSEPVAVTPEEIKLVQGARDYIAKLIEHGK